MPADGKRAVKAGGGPTATLDISGFGVDGYAFIPDGQSKTDNKGEPEQIIFIATGKTRKYGIFPVKRTLNLQSTAQKPADTSVAEPTEVNGAHAHGLYFMYKSDSLTEQVNAAHHEGRLDRLRSKIFGSKTHTAYKMKPSTPSAGQNKAINRETDQDAISQYTLPTPTGGSSSHHVSWAENYPRGHDGHQRRNSKYTLHPEDKYPGK